MVRNATAQNISFSFSLHRSDAAILQIAGTLQNHANEKFRQGYGNIGRSQNIKNRVRSHNIVFSPTILNLIPRILFFFLHGNEEDSEEYIKITRNKKF